MTIIVPRCLFLEGLTTMKVQMDEREEKPAHSMPAASTLEQLIAVLSQQLAREAQQKAAEQQERARFNYD